MRKISREVKVDYVSPDGSQVTILIGNVRLTFAKIGEKLEILSRGSLAQVYDPKNLDVPSNLMQDAYRLSAIVLREKRKRINARAIRDSVQISLQFV